MVLVLLFFLLFSELFSPYFHAPWNLSCYLVEVAQPPWRNVFSREKKKEPSVFPLPFPYSLQFVSPKSFNRQLSNIVCPIPVRKRKQDNHPISPKEENQTWNHINTQWKTKPDLFTEVKANMLFNAGIKETHPAMYTAKLKRIQNLIRGRRATRVWLCLKIQKAALPISPSEWDLGRWGPRSWPAAPCPKGPCCGSIPCPSTWWSWWGPRVRGTGVWGLEKVMDLINMPVILSDFKYTDSFQTQNFLKHCCSVGCHLVSLQYLVLEAQGSESKTKRDIIW